MKILVIGGGGREHSLVWKISQSPLVKKVFCAPGNAGIAEQAECVSIEPTDFSQLSDLVLKEKIDLTVVGPEVPLVAGIVNHFHRFKLRIFGPTQEAAELEGSKVFCKDLLRRAGIPTASYRVFSDMPTAQEYLKRTSYPIVIKADGLAAGKGVFVCPNYARAAQSIHDVMEKKSFALAGQKVVIEEFLTGEEISILVLTDGETIIALEPAQDHKRVYDNDKGPNTGGMGAYSPVPFVTEASMHQIIETILVPTVHALNRAKRRYQGVLYAGLILTPTGPKVLEYNVRFGDPETQPLMIRLKSDLVPLMVAVTENKLKEAISLEWSSAASVCVVMASSGYPGSYQKGFPIGGLDDLRKQKDIHVFHAGTALKDERIVTAGGRVLGVTASGHDLKQARGKCYQAVKQISFKDNFYRRDIAQKALVGK